MNPRRVWGSHCRTWLAFDVRLPAGVTAVVGENGAGKSTLLNAIDVALFGKGAELARMLTRDCGETTVEVGLEFEHDGHLYRVRRCAGKKTTFDLERGFGAGQLLAGDVAKWDPLTLSTMAETQARLEEILGLTRQTFRASAFLAQGDGSAFTLAAPRERKAILADVLRLQIYDSLQEKAKTDRQATEQELSRLVARAEQLQGEQTMRDSHQVRLAEARMELDRARLDLSDRTIGLTKLQEELADARVLAERRQTATAEVLRLESEQNDDVARLDQTERQLAEAVEEPGKRERAEQLAPRVTELEVELAQSRVEAGAIDTANAERGRLDVERQRLEHEIKTALDTVDREVADVARLQHERDRPRTHGTESDTCPTCLRPLAGDMDAIRAIVQTLADQQAAAERRRDTASATAARDQASLAELEALLRDLPAGDSAPLWEKVAATVDDLARAQAADRWLLAANEAAKTRGLLEHSRADLREVLGAREKALAAARAAAAAIPSVHLAELHTLERQATLGLQAAQQLVSDWDRREALEQAALARLDEQAAELEIISNERATVAADSTVLRELERAFGRDGIPALILENAALPYLEAEASRIVGELGRGYRFELRTQRATQAGTVAEALDIVVHTDTGEALYEDFSGGERTRLDLALRIALARLLANRRGADVRLLAIDEPSYLDEQGLAMLAVLLRSLPEFERTLLVSHQPALRDAFDNYIEVAGGGETGEPSRVVSNAPVAVAA